jgi:hypothetical protein
MFADLVQYSTMKRGLKEEETYIQVSSSSHWILNQAKPEYEPVMST